MIRSPLARPPGAPVSFGADGSRTAAELLCDADRIAAILADLPPGEVVVACDDRYRFAAALLGAWRTGRIVALPPSGAPAAVAALAREAAGLLHDRDGAEGLDVRPVLDAGGPPPPLRPWPSVDADRPLAILATSGSTGAPQRWAKTAGQLVGEAAVLAGTFGVGPGDVVLATVPALHIYGLLFGLLLPLRAGGVLVRETPLHPEAVAAAAARHGARFLATVPAHLRALASLERLPPLGRIFSSGAPLPEADARAIAALAGRGVVEVLGSTETGGLAWRDGPGVPWYPFPDVTIAAGDDGALLVDSPRLAPDAPRPFVCADRIAPAADGSFRLLGRADGVVKVAGKRVSLAELEARTLALPGVRDAAALAVPTSDARGVELQLAVAGDGLDAAAIRAGLSAWLDPVAVPRRIRIVGALPREATGKLRRAALEDLLAEPDGPRSLEPVAVRAGTDARNRDVRELDFEIPPDLVHFRGHFPGHPVLPAVFQLEGLVLRQLAARFPDLGAPRRLLRLKFKQLIRPGTRLTLHLARAPGAGSVDFDLQGPRGSCASGTFDCEVRR